MTLDETLLQNLAKWRPHSPRQVLDVAHPDSGTTVTLVADAVDELAGKWWEMRLTRTSPLPETTPALSLQERAERVAARVTGLLEPLRVIEVDAEQDVAQLRSHAPAVEGESLSYYEVTLHGHGGARVERYEGGREGKRRQVPFALTHDAVGKLVRDLIA